MLTPKVLDSEVLPLDEAHSVACPEDIYLSFKALFTSMHSEQEGIVAAIFDPLNLSNQTDPQTMQMQYWFIALLLSVCHRDDEVVEKVQLLCRDGRVKVPYVFSKRFRTVPNHEKIMFIKYLIFCLTFWDNPGKFIPVSSSGMICFPGTLSEQDQLIRAYQVRCYLKGKSILGLPIT